MNEEGYIEVTTNGMRLIGPVTTKHVMAMMLGMLVSLPLAGLLVIVGLAIPGPRFLPLILAGVGFLPGIVLGVWPIPNRKISVMTMLYRRYRFKWRTQVYVWDREYRVQKNRAVITAWMREVDEAVRRQQAEGDEPI